MKLLTILYIFCLLYVFVPGNVIKLPIKTSNTNIILIHAFAFSVILSCTYDFVDHVNLIEGMRPNEKESVLAKTERRIREKTERRMREEEGHKEGFKEGVNKEGQKELEELERRQANARKRNDGW